MRYAGIVVLFLALQGCIATYRDFPIQGLERRAPQGEYTKLSYNIKRFDILDMGGYEKLREVFRKADFLEEADNVATMKSGGTYVEVETKWKPLSLPALVFGYISVSTLTLLPAWSTQDGYLVKYRLFVNGKEEKVFTYEITRKAGVWLLFLPLAWVNLFTYSEADAFEATAYQFFQDAGPLLARSRN